MYCCCEWLESMRNLALRRSVRLGAGVAALLAVVLIGSLTLATAASNDERADLAALRDTFDTGVAALNASNLDGFLDTVHDEALSFYSCGPTSGKQGREACAIDWQLFFNTTIGAHFETRDPQYRIIGDTGVAYGSYALSVNYNNQRRQVVHEGRYTMTYTQVDGVWKIVMQHNTPAGDDPQPVRGLRPDGR